jgi:hypothetical protein
MFPGVRGRGALNDIIRFSPELALFIAAAVFILVDGLVGIECL